MRDLYNENYKILLKEIKEDINKWKHIYGHILKDLILLKCQYYPEQSTDSMQCLYRNPSDFCTNREEPILKFTWNLKGPWIAKTILKKNRKTGGFTLPDFQILLQSYRKQNSVAMA